MAEFALKQFEDLRQDWDDLRRKSPARLLFSSPSWCEVWWQHFSEDNELYLGAVTEQKNIIGIAPLRLKDGILYFIGNTLLLHLTFSNHKVMDLSPLLPDSTAYRLFTSAARGGKIKVECLNDDVSVALDLPQDLPAYLSRLNSKQRHELLRKERRLREEGEVSYEVKAEPAAGDVDIFLDFFRESREDKNRFLTPEMESFFRDIIGSAAADRTLRLGMLKLNQVNIAATLCFDYRGEIYLYNSGYNPAYRSLSAGLLSKYYSVKQSIETGKSRYDFLRGAERYKYHLGGSETQLFRCIINI
ncbi:MAG: GNAT family N-acetyltransferase [Chloroflexi bacterium]|nr:GNAT family N-acetyltransferase [Chloroflexota bacterium]